MRLILPETSLSFSSPSASQLPSVALLMVDIYTYSRICGVWP
jgi:hypothetical protein